MPTSYEHKSIVTSCPKSLRQKNLITSLTLKDPTKMNKTRSTALRAAVKFLRSARISGNSAVMAVVFFISAYGCILRWTHSFCCSIVRGGFQGVQVLSSISL